MGDRANVAIGEGKDVRVYIYVHWLGHELPELVRGALNADTARNRWHDTPYLTRIIADAISAKAGGAGSETGMGISTGVQDDNQGRVLVLDVETQEAFYETLGGQQTGPRIPFETFARHPQQWPRTSRSEALV